MWFQTIFEICGKNKSQEYQVMKEKRVFHKEKITDHYRIQEQKQENLVINSDKNRVSLPVSNADDLNDAFKEVVLPKKRKMDILYKKNKKLKVKDTNYIPYAPSDQHTEQG